MHNQVMDYLKIAYLLMGVGAALIVYVVYLGEELRRAWLMLANGLLSVVTHFLLVSCIVVMWLPLAVVLFVTRRMPGLVFRKR